MCIYCDLNEKRSGKLVWLQGEEFHTEDSRTFATIEQSPGFDPEIVITHPSIEEDDFDNGFVPIRFCPWCGRKLV